MDSEDHLKTIKIDKTEGWNNSYTLWMQINIQIAFKQSKYMSFS